jgi:hypothetical protein
MVKRNENGKLELRTLDLAIFLDDLFDACQTEREIEWLKENIESALEGSMQDKLDQIED